MDEFISNWKADSVKNEDENFDFLTSLKMKNARRVDALAAEIHAEAFQKINCLDCANCCKTLGTLVTKADAIRISDFLEISTQEFHEIYLEKDEEGDLMIKTLPCPFLAEDNTCKIYSVRPKECKGYPHTHKKGFASRRFMHSQNTLTCPAVFYIVEKMKNIYRY